ncbi:Nucleolin 2 [Linum grandiflorum]
MAYVEFADTSSISKALELDGSELAGEYLTMQEARPRPDRDASGGGGRGFGGRGGRGRIAAVVAAVEVLVAEEAAEPLSMKVRGRPSTIRTLT